jgi:hypothetical protein
MRHVIPVAALLVLGCSSPPLEPECSVYPGESVPENLAAELVVSDAFSADELEVIVGAADEWRERTGGRAALTLVVGQAEADARGTVVKVDEPTCCGRVAETWTRARRVTFVGTVTRRSAVHELGHLLGLGHLADQGAVMSGCHEGPAAVGAGDVAAFDELYPVD